MDSIAFPLSASLWHSVAGRLHAWMQAHGAHPHRTLVLLPYAQLMPEARSAWAQMGTSSGSSPFSRFVPRFETTMNWATHENPAFAYGELDIRFELAADLLTAARWLDQAGLAAVRDDLAAALVEATWQLAAVTAAQPPNDRAAWGAQVRSGLLTGVDYNLLRFEAAVARIALEWALASSYASDVLFAEDTFAALDALVLVRGFLAEPLSESLLKHYGHKGHALQLVVLEAVPAQPKVPSNKQATTRLHACADAHEEAERAAACVLRLLASSPPPHTTESGHAPRWPIAMVANDRSVVRRVRALLGVRGVRVRDETGWKLSTTHAAAALMALLRCAERDANADALLQWAKLAPACDRAAVDSLEHQLRRSGTRDWRGLQGTSAAAQAVLVQINTWCAVLQNARPLAEWTVALRQVLQACGLWRALAQDEAGVAVLQALHLAPDHQAAGHGLGQKQDLPASSQRWSLGDFTRWVNAVLEGASFKPLQQNGAEDAADAAVDSTPDVVVLPLSQLLCRSVSGVVVPGCDEANLPVSPELPGTWTTAQRVLLGLPQRETLQRAAGLAWHYLMEWAQASPGRVDLLWRTEEAGEAVMASGFVQTLRLQHPALADDPRLQSCHTSTPVQPPQPRADAILRPSLSASAYADLRACPYRYFGLRSLGLAEAEELDTMLDKRDFGNWLHLVLRYFHTVLLEANISPNAANQPACLATMAQAVAQATQELALDEAAFTPFAAAWPRVRDGYLKWLLGHTEEGATFAEAESWKEQPLGRIKLVGKMDRVDTLADGRRMVIDYKTESPQTTRDRLADPLNDTQLPFYAALLADDDLQAAYVNVGEKDGTKTFSMPTIVEVRDQLIDGILHDMERIAQGDSLPALGEGSACEYCAARGLCRRDYWK